MSLRIIYKAQRGMELHQGRGNKVGSAPLPGSWRSAAYVTYLLYHDTIDAHVFLTPGEVEDVDPAQSQTQHQEGKVFVPATEIHPCCCQEEESLEKTGVSSGQQEQWFYDVNRGKKEG